MAQPTKNPELISYSHLLKFVGWLALLLPVITCLFYGLLGGKGPAPLDSISEYYYTFMRDIFTGILFMVGLFLYAYKGYNNWENLVFNFAAILCALIALFGMDPVDFPLTGFPHIFNNRILILHYHWYSVIHYTSASVLFVILGYVSFFLFTKTHQTEDPTSPIGPTPKKLQRNVLYRICGILIWGALAFYVACCALGVDVHHTYILFVVETICLWAFGFAWLTKGDGVIGLSD
jgi:hypothetical protein